MKRTCPNCGAVYELSEFKIPVRDKDSLECEFCDATLIRWNGAVYWEIRKVLKKPDRLRNKE